MLPKKINSFLWHFSNYTTPSSTPGTSVTPGASNAEGSWTRVASSADMAYDSCLMYIAIGSGAFSGVAENHLLDIGVDPAGGTSYTAIISNIVCGQTQAVTTGWDEFVFPIFIKAGSSVAVRVQGSHSTAGTVRVVADFFGRPTNPEMVPCGSYSETIGSITNSNGQSITPGTAGEGSWTSLGTTAKDLWHWQIGVQVDNSTITAQYTSVDLAYGDASNKEIILEDVPICYIDIGADPYLPFVVFGLHMNGTNGSTTFTELTGKTVTANGNAQISTAQYANLTGNSSSGYFDGTGDYLNATLTGGIGSGDMTIDFWVRESTFSGDRNYIAINNGAVTNVFIGNSNTGAGDLRFVVRNDSGTTNIDLSSSGTTISLNTWAHIRAAVSGSTAYLFINGTLVNSGALTGTRSGSGTDLQIARLSSGLTRYFTGYLDDLRITKGIARSTASFTVPSTQFPDFFYGTAEIKASPLRGRSLVRASRYVPGGSTIYARAGCSTLPATGYNMVAIGIGG